MNKELYIFSFIKFVDKLKVTEQIEKGIDEIPKLKGSLGNLPVDDWSDKLIETSPIISKSLMKDLQDNKIEVLINNKWYGFKQNSDYIDYYKLINEFLEQKSYKDIISFEYLREKVLLWIIEIYQNNKVTIDLFQYLDELTSIDVIDTIYYFPLLNIEIEKEILINDSSVMYFSQDYFDTLWKNKNSTDKKTFDDIYRKHQGRVFVKVVVKAERSMGERIAFEKAGLITDIIKLISPTVGFAKDICGIDLSARIPFWSEYLTDNHNNKLGFSITKSVNRNTVFFSQEIITSFKPIIELFSEVIERNSNSELNRLTINSIKLFSKSISENDLNVRISQLITIIESIFLQDNEVHKMEKKCKRRMSYFLYSDNGKEKEKFSKIISLMYNIRHKIIHKSIRLYVEIDKLSRFQMGVMDTILKLIHNGEKLVSKNELIRIIDIKSTPNKM